MPTANEGGFNPMFLLSLIPGIGGLLSGAFASADSPRDKAMEEMLKRIQGYIPYLRTSALSKSEIQSQTTRQARSLRGGADAAAGRLGSAIGEADIAGGQGFAEYYMQALAPVLQQGLAQSVQAEQVGNDLIMKSDQSAKNNLLQALSLMSGVSGAQPDMTSGQRGFSGFLQGANMFSSGIGSLAEAYKNFNYKGVS